MVDRQRFGEAVYAWVDTGPGDVHVENVPQHPAAELSALWKSKDYYVPLFVMPIKSHQV